MAVAVNGTGGAVGLGGMLFWAGLGSILYLILEGGQLGLELGFAGSWSALLAAAREAFLRLPLSPHKIGGYNTLKATTATS